MPDGHIFLSYRNIEADFALKLAADLKNAGVNLWMDRLDIRPDEDRIKSLQQAVNESIGFIAVLSPDYVKSKYCQRELARADRLGHAIYPILIGNLEKGDWPLAVSRSQYIDFRDWHDDEVYHLRLGELLTLLKDTPNYKSRKVDDFYAGLVTEIQAGNIDWAIESILGMDLSSQLETLARLSSALELAVSSDVGRDPDRPTTSMRAVALARAIARNLALTLDLIAARAIAHEKVRDLGHDLVLDLALDLSRDLAQDDYLIYDHGGHHRFAISINKTLIRCLELLTNNQAEVSTGFTTHFTVTGIDTLTPRHLASTVAPYLQAIFDLQQTILKIRGAEYIEPRVRWISQNSPVEIKLVDIAETVETIRDWVVPWRRENAKRLADLATEKQKLDNEQAKVALQKAKLELIDMALDIVDRYSPGLPDNQRLALAMELIPSINTLAVDSPLQITDISKPRTLPP